MKLRNERKEKRVSVVQEDKTTVKRHKDILNFIERDELLKLIIKELGDIFNERNTKHPIESIGKEARKQRVKYILQLCSDEQIISQMNFETFKVLMNEFIECICDLDGIPVPNIVFENLPQGEFNGYAFGYTDRDTIIINSSLMLENEIAEIPKKYIGITYLSTIVHELRHIEQNYRTSLIFSDKDFAFDLASYTAFIKGLYSSNICLRKQEGREFENYQIGQYLGAIWETDARSKEFIFFREELQRDIDEKVFENLYDAVVFNIVTDINPVVRNCTYSMFSKMYTKYTKGLFEKTFQGNSAVNLLDKLDKFDEEKAFEVYQNISNEEDLFIEAYCKKNIQVFQQSGDYVYWSIFEDVIRKYNFKYSTIALMVQMFKCTRNNDMQGIKALGQQLYPTIRDLKVDTEKAVDDIIFAHHQLFAIYGMLGNVEMQNNKQEDTLTR